MKDIKTFRERVLEQHPELGESLEQNKPKREIALSLRALRKHTGMSQTLISHKSGLSIKQVERLESATGDIDLTAMFKYAEACGVEPEIRFRDKNGNSIKIVGANGPK